MSVTLIAEKAGVSIATVSRVLNNSRRVNPQMADQVHKAVAALNLIPRQSRRRLRVRAIERPTTIAVVALGQSYRGWFEMPVIASAVAELTRSAQEMQMGVFMTEMADPYEISPLLKRPDVSGAIVFVNSSIDAASMEQLNEQLPIVRVMGGQLAPLSVDHVTVDNNVVGFIAAEHLMHHGCRELAFVTTSPNWDFVRLRAQGFIAASEASNILPTCYLASSDRPMVGLYGPQSVLSNDLRGTLAHLAEKRSGSLGVFVSRDEEAVEIYRLFREIGVEPGRDVRIVSCDNEAVRLSTLHPRPVSIDLGTDEIARRAVRRLAMRIENRTEAPVRILVNPRLVGGDA